MKLFIEYESKHLELSFGWDKEDDHEGMISIKLFPGFGLGIKLSKFKITFLIK